MRPPITGNGRNQFTLASAEKADFSSEVKVQKSDRMALVVCKQHALFLRLASRHSFAGGRRDRRATGEKKNPRGISGQKQLCGNSQRTRQTPSLLNQARTSRRH